MDEACDSGRISDWYLETWAWDPLVSALSWLERADYSTSSPNQSVVVCNKQTSILQSFVIYSLQLPGARVQVAKQKDKALR